VLVIYIAIESDKASDIFIAFILGYLQDIFSGNPVGLFAMLRTITFIITRFLNLNLFAKNRLFFVVTTFIVSIFDSIYLGYQFNSDGYGFFTILLDSFYLSFLNALMALIIYPLLNKIEGIYLKMLKEQEGRF
jgi:rod shape-determining protein MreD